MRFLEQFRHMVGLLGRVISPSQGLYLHRTTQHRKTRDKHPCLKWDSNPRSQQPPAKTHASDRTATVTGTIPTFPKRNKLKGSKKRCFSRFTRGTRQSEFLTWACKSVKTFNQNTRYESRTHVHCKSCTTRDSTANTGSIVSRLLGRISARIFVHTPGKNTSELKKLCFLGRTNFIKKTSLKVF
jgi:hypothetical protein